MCQADLERRSVGSDSGRTKKPYRALAKLRQAAAQKGKRRVMLPRNPPTAETVGARAEDGRKNELHERPGETEIAGDGGGAGDVAAFEMDDEVGENGSDDAECQKIEEDGDQNEDEGGAAGLGLRRWGRGGGQRKLLREGRL